jgi:hypothetical protein
VAALDEVCREQKLVRQEREHAEARLPRRLRHTPLQHLRHTTASVIREAMGHEQQKRTEPSLDADKLCISIVHRVKMVSIFMKVEYV